MRAELANCVNRDEYTKRMASLSKRIKEIMESMANRGLQQDEGMLSKKNLGPIACASCEKDLINISGM